MIKFDGYTSFAYDDDLAYKVPDHERQHHANNLRRMAESGDMPYDATLVSTGDMLLLALRDKSTGRIEYRELTPVSSHWPGAK